MNVINVYTIITSDYLQNLKELYNLLSVREKIQSTKFITPSLSNRYIITRAALRGILAKHLNVIPQDIEFITNSYGKPSVKGNSIKFNMSHSIEMAYYAVSISFDLGIDVEFFNRKKNIFDIAKSVFSTTEFDFFIKLSNDERQEFFFETWVKKEAMIKAVGLGLSYPMKEVDTLQMHNNHSLELCGSQYYLYRLASDNFYKAYLVVKDQENISIEQQFMKLCCDFIT